MEARERVAMASPLNQTDLSANRKLIRPSLAEVRDQLSRGTPGSAGAGAGGSAVAASASAPAAGSPSPSARPPKKPVPPDQTNAESFYYLKQMQTKTEMVLVLRDGEQIRGVIEWYDRHCLKVHRQGEPNLLVYKSMVKYMFKADEANR